ncbi:hypothetical protein ACK8OT_19350, partial [Motilimonas sp. KMU-193]
PFDATSDQDGDGLTAWDEYRLGTDPNDPDSDRDGAPDYIDSAPLNSRYSFDNDRDGLPQEWEMQYGLSDSMPLDAKDDFDADGLTNLQEFLTGTNPHLADSDHDGELDGSDFAPT